MILRNRLEGPSTYAKVVNSFFLDLDVAQGHRNRIDKLTDILGQQAARVVARGRPFRVLNIGCGPAEEVSRFVRRNVLSAAAEFTLVDFNRETLDYARRQVSAACEESGRWPAVQYVQKSVNDLQKDAVRSRAAVAAAAAAEPKYDLVYCAGLFDYLSDKVCTRLIEMMYQWVLPRGAVVVTNVHPRHTAHAILDDLVEWRLTLRTEQQVLALAPRGLGVASVDTEPMGTNVFLEIRKAVDVADDLGAGASPNPGRAECRAAAG
jgi:extracellular factor (EF) 3-hydroxypalmitic acid methyl ester biosynthesis protein